MMLKVDLNKIICESNTNYALGTQSDLDPRKQTMSLTSVKVLTKCVVWVVLHAQQ